MGVAVADVVKALALVVHIAPVWTLGRPPAHKVPQ